MKPNAHGETDSYKLIISLNEYKLKVVIENVVKQFHWIKRKFF